MKTVIITLLSIAAYGQTPAVITPSGDLHIPGSYYGDGSHLTGISGSGTASVAGYTTVSYSTTPVFPVTTNTGQSFLITLTGNVTSSTATTVGITNSGRPIVTFRICQDGSGSHTFVWPTNVQDHGTVDATASACSSQVFVYDGTNFQALGTILVTGPAGGAFTLPGSSSGSTVLQPSAAAGGVVTIPNATDTLVGKATTDTLTNKSFDTAGTGNSLKVNGVAITGVSGTGDVCLVTGSSCSAGGGGTMFSTAGVGSYWPFGYPQSAGVSSMNGVPAANRVIYREIVIPSGMTVRSAAWFQQADDAGKHYTWGLYNSSFGLVTNAQCGTVTSTANSAMTCTFAGAVSLTAGTYYWAYSTDSSTQTITIYSTAGSQVASQLLAAASGNPRIFYGSTASTGTSTITLPSSFSSDTRTARAFEEFPHILLLP